MQRLIRKHGPLSLLAGAFIAALLPVKAPAQDAPSWQPDARREVCTATQMLDAPGGAPLSSLSVGDSVTRSDLRFGSDLALYIEVALEARAGFVPVTAVARSCEYADRKSAAAKVFAAPPNTCHLIAASRRTVEEVNEFTAQQADYWPQMSVFQSDSGWYAVSFGLVTRQIARDIISGGRDISPDAYCSDGVRYIAALDPVGPGRFAVARPSTTQDETPQDPAARAAVANGLLREWEGKGDKAVLRQSCLLGNGVACNQIAWALRDQSAQSPAIAQERLRFDLLGCMLGEEASCTNALFIEGDTLNRPLKVALPQQRFEEDGPPGLYPELAATGCDMNVISACQRLSLPLLTTRLQRTRDRYLTLIEAARRSCLRGQRGDCEMLALAAQDRGGVSGLDDWTSMDQLALGRLLFVACRGDTAEAGTCRQAVRYLNRFLQGASSGNAAAGEAARMIGEACRTNIPDACAYQSNLSGHFDKIARSEAARKAQELCNAAETPAEICARLVQVMGNDLDTAADAFRQDYAQRAATCRADTATPAQNPCTDAFDFFARNISQTDLAEPVSLLRETCVGGGKTTGCAMLGDYYTGLERRYPGGAVVTSVQQRDLAIAAWRIGCDSSVEGIEACSSLAGAMEQSGDFEQASGPYRTGCGAALHSGAAGKGSAAICYDGAKNARVNLQDYATARAWFDAACNRFDEPFACKFLGLMYARGEGGAADPITAADLYRRACFYREPLLADEQACFFLGQLLVAERDVLTRDRAESGRELQPSAQADSARIEGELLTLASQAFLVACRGGAAGPHKQACADQRELLSDWTRGDYPTVPVSCTTIGTDGIMAAPQTCAAFTFYLSEQFDGGGQEFPASVYVWPDGQRTINVEWMETTRLNGALTDFDGSHIGWLCYRSRTSGRSFCRAE